MPCYSAPWAHTHKDYMKYVCKAKCIPQCKCSTMISSSTLHTPISNMPILKTFLGKMPAIYIKRLIFNMGFGLFDSSPTPLQIKPFLFKKKKKTRLIFLPLKKPSCIQLPFFTFFYYLSPIETEKLLHNTPLCFQSADFNIRPFTCTSSNTLFAVLTIAEFTKDLAS